MAEFQKVANEIKRMCDKLKCSECPLGSKNTLANGICTTWTLQHPEKSESIVMQWAAEHPIMTNGMKFKEVFGNHVVWETDEDMEAWLNAEYKGGQEKNG